MQNSTLNTGPQGENSSLQTLQALKQMLKQLLKQLPEPHLLHRPSRLGNRYHNLAPGWCIWIGPGHEMSDLHMPKEALFV